MRARVTILTLTSALLAMLALRPTSSVNAAPPADASVTKQSVEQAVARFIDGLNSLSIEKALSNLTAGDRHSLIGKDNILGLVSERKMTLPTVKNFVAIQEKGRTIGARAIVLVQEEDAIDGTRSQREYTWVLIKEDGALRVSLMSLWMERQASDEKAEASQDKDPYKLTE